MSRYPTDSEAREAILDCGRRLYERGLVAANDGNITARVSAREVWATPTNVSKGFMSADSLVKLDLDGNVLSGSKPSSEIKMHLAIYRRAPDILAVVHAHPPTATAFAAAGIPLSKSTLAETEALLGEIPVAPFAPLGTAELADGVAAYCAEYKGVLMARHGVCSWGSGVTEALFNMERIEFTAKIAYMLGQIKPPT
ncbi:MAG: class II aldolase/adducin family protein [Oscillospiraceae bacterium]|jgi:L-fuculose-phosphate aldolase|nr:class II aldolase/adducin family protein [Oscillospiraceae bacterium]